MWRRGTTSTCSSAAGLMSLKAMVPSVSWTMSDDSSPATILQKMQSSCSDVASCRRTPHPSARLHGLVPPTGATVPVRSEAMSAPAVTAAVSARSTLSPNPTVDRPEPSSSLLHPPSGPTATTRWARVGRSPLSWASATSPGAPERAQLLETDGVGHLGQPDAPALGRRLPGDPAQALDRGLTPLSGPAHHAAFAAQRDDTVDPELGQLLDHPLGTLALGRGEDHGQRRLGRRLHLHRPVTSDPGYAREQLDAVTPPGGTGPAAPTVGDHDFLVRDVGAGHGRGGARPRLRASVRRGPPRRPGRRQRRGPRWPRLPRSY